jgi:hypothetical protein
VSEELRGRVAEVLRRHAGDPDALVAVNVAMWLAEKFRDPSQVDTLRRCLDWTYLQSRGFSAEVQPILVCRAMECLVKLKDLDSLPAIRRLAADNRNYKVKNTALRALRDGFGGAHAMRSGDSRSAGTAAGPARPSAVKTVSR